jgi:hypothetical protein
MSFEHPAKKYSFRQEKWHEYTKKKYYTIPENEEELNKELREIEELPRKLFKYFDDIPQY